MEIHGFLDEKEMEAVRLFASKVRGLLGDNLIVLKLFGSKARGDFGAESDIDILLVVREKDWDLYYKVCSIATDLALEFGAEISPTIITEKEFGKNRDHNTAFYESVEKEGLPV